MADIVVLYRKSERGRIQPVIEWLRESFWTYWLDEMEPAGPWPSAVEREIDACRCVLPLWTEASRADGSEVLNEVNLAKQLNKPRIHVCLDEVRLPLHVSLEVRTYLDLRDPSHGYRELSHRLLSVLGGPNVSEQHVKPAARPRSLVFGDKEYPLPAFIRSVSSYETPLVRPEDALLALNLHPSLAPILVSSFDLSNHGAERSYPDCAPSKIQFRELLKTHDERGRIIFLDSGNYEAYRVKRGLTDAVDESEKWLLCHHLEVLTRELTIDLPLSFDQQYKKETVDKKVKTIIEWCKKGALRSPAIPILHATKDSRGNVDFDDLDQVITKVVVELDCDMIAIPERDLGDGIRERVKAVRRIRQMLNDTGRYRLLHLLGTGNPYTILMLAAAGADLFDGLEWCRLAVDAETGRLHHPHHFDMFWGRMKFSEYDAVRDVFKANAYPVIFKMLIHNLDFFDSWMKEVRHAVHGGSAEGMLFSYLSAGSVSEAADIFAAALEEELGGA